MGMKTRIRVPKDGFVVSQHAEAGGFCWAVQIGNYVGVDYTSSKAYLYTSVDGYLLNHKTVAVGGQYGVLPTPKRETYTFDGWYTAASGGTKITAGSTYSVDKLYAHWTSNDPCASGHSWNSGTVTTAATCEKAGIKTYTCTVCKTTKTETIAALGHSYKETKIAGSCTQRPGTKYDCTRCGNSYTAWDEASWSSWSTEKPSGYTGGDIESATQYRYRDKDTTTSSSASMTGWTLSGSEKVWGDYGAWSDWTTEAVSAGDSTQVETAPLYRYYYFLCSKCGDHNPFSGNCGCGGTSNDLAREIFHDLVQSEQLHGGVVCIKQAPDDVSRRRRTAVFLERKSECDGDRNDGCRRKFSGYPSGLPIQDQNPEHRISLLSLGRLEQLVAYKSNSDRQPRSGNANGVPV